MEASLADQHDMIHDIPYTGALVTEDMAAYWDIPGRGGAITFEVTPGACYGNAEPMLYVTGGGSPLGGSGSAGFLYAGGCGLFEQ